MAEDIYSAILSGNLQSVVGLIEKHRASESNRNPLVAEQDFSADTDSTSTRSIVNSWSAPRGRNGDTPLHLAARLGHVHILEILLDVVNLNVPNKDGKRPLHEAASASKADCVRLLLSRGAPVDALKRADWTPLMMACTKDSLDTIEPLLESGASTERTNKDGWNSFHIACREGHFKTMGLLLTQSPHCWDTKSTNGRTPLHTVALHGHQEALELLLEKCQYDLDVQDSCGSTPVMDALRRGHTNIAQALLDHGATLLKYDMIGRLPVHIVAESGQLDSLEFLVKRKEDLNVRCRGGSTALHLAAKEGHLRMIEQLIDFGADCHVTDDKGRTALAVAQGCRKIDCCDLLAKYQTQTPRSI